MLLFGIWRLSFALEVNTIKLLMLDTLEPTTWLIPKLPLQGRDPGLFRRGCDQPRFVTALPFLQTPSGSSAVSQTVFSARLSGIGYGLLGLRE